MAPPSLSHRGNHTDFVRRFTQGQAQKHRQPHAKPLTAAQRAALRKQLKGVHFLKPDFADNTKVNIVGILRKWKGYCQSAELGHWKKVMQKADRAMAMDFLHHLCESYNIKSEGTSWEYFRQYKQLYASITGQYMDRNDSREILKVCYLESNPVL